MIKVRTAGRSDLPGIFEIYDHHVLHGTATAQTVPLTDPQRQEWFDRHPPDLHPLLVAHDEAGAVAGWAGLAPWSPREAYRRTAESSVYVADLHHGRGVGLALMRELIERARRDTPVRVIVARPGETNVASIRLHEKLGFQTVGVLPNCMEKFDELLSVRIMLKELNDSRHDRYPL